MTIEILVSGQPLATCLQAQGAETVSKRDDDPKRLLGMGAAADEQ